ncbi:MAG: helix-turn-helix transcriptional regulator [Bacilli bacterium]|nr:helix-turn-helix transcriptional regulator [Bacilli bacterium]
MNVNVQLGMRIRYLRKQKGMSQEDLALESEVNKNYISDLERGNRNPTVIILERIAVALDVDLSTLFKGILSIE